MKFKAIFSLLFFTLLLLASCNSFLVDSITPTSVVIPTSSNSPRSTETTTPSLSVTPSSTYSLTEIAVATTRAAYVTELAYRFTAIPATIEARNAKCKEGFVLEQALYVLDYSNEKWTLFTCSPVPANKYNLLTPGVVDYGTRYTQLVETDLSKTWTIQHNPFDYSIIDRSDALMVPFRWTADGRYLYLYPAYYPGPSGGTDSMLLETNVNDLYRINLETGNFELILRSDQYEALALSPDDQYLIYSEHKRPDVIHVRNMESGDDLQIKLNEDIIVSGRFIWGSDRDKVVFTVGYGKQVENFHDDLSETALFVLTLSNMHVQKVLARDSRIFIPEPCFDGNYWLDKNTMCLYSINEKLDSWNKYFTFNIETGSVVFLRPFP